MSDQNHISPHATRNKSSYASRSAHAHTNTNANTNTNTNTNNGTHVAPSTGSSVTPTRTSSTRTESSATQSSTSQVHDSRQTRILAESSRKVQEHSYYLRRAMDHDDISDTLDHAMMMLGELGEEHHRPHSHHSSPSPYPDAQLSPRSYYELHMKVLEEMPNLEDFFLSVAETPEIPVSALDLYELVQYCPKLVPRLYLQICAGSALIRSKERNPKDTLDDLVSHVKCVQCPTRGLFLRSYLLQATRDKLPDVGGDFYSAPVPLPDFFDDAPPVAPGEEPHGRGTLEDSYNFILSNFVAMSNLWVRMHHLPGDRSSKDRRRRREKERNELRVLVGTNLVRLSSLDGITPGMYRGLILPRILEQILTCNDALAQAYLMDCVIQVFGDEFHLAALDEFLGVCPMLKEKVNIRTILQSMMERLAKYAEGGNSLEEMPISLSLSGLLEENGDSKTTSTSTKEEINANMLPEGVFDKFEKCVEKTRDAKMAKMVLTFKELIRIETALLSFAIRCYPKNLNRVASILETTTVGLEQLRQVSSQGDLDMDAVDELEKMLSIPLEALSQKVLEMEYYEVLLAFLPWPNRRRVALDLLRSVTSCRDKFTNADKMDTLMGILDPVLKDPHKNEPVIVGQDEDYNDPGSRTFKHEQGLVARLVHLLYHDDTDKMFIMLSTARNYLKDGGKYRLRHTMVPLFFATISLLCRIRDVEFQETQEILSEPVEVQDLLNLEQGNETLPSEVDKIDINDDNININDDNTDVSIDNINNIEPSKENENGIKEEPEETKLLLIDTQQVTAENEDPNETDPKHIDAIVSESPPLPPTAPPPPPPTFTKTVNCRKIFLFFQKIISTLSPHHPSLAIQLLLQTSILADQIATHSDTFSTIAYEFTSLAFQIYEQDIQDHRQQFQAVQSMVGTLLQCRHHQKEDYEKLITKVTQYGAKMLKKPDQCKMIVLCSHLFFTGDGENVGAYRNPQRVLECLQRSLKIADACAMASPSTSASLFILILDHYVYYFEKDNPVITDRFISGLVALIREHLGSSGNALEASSGMKEEAMVQYRQLLKYVQKKKAEDPEKFGRIAC